MSCATARPHGFMCLMIAAAGRSKSLTSARAAAASWMLLKPGSLPCSCTAPPSPPGCDPNGYRLQQSRSMVLNPWVSRAAMCSGLSRRASSPAWTPGCRVLTRPSIISGNPVSSETGFASIAASESTFSVLPVAKRSKPKRWSPRAKPVSPFLSLTDSRALGKSCLQQPDRRGKDPVLGLVYSPAQGLHRIAFQDRDSFLGQDRAGIQVFGHQVHRRTGDLDAALQRLLNRIHAATEFGQKRGVDVDDAASKRFQERARVDAVIAGIDDELDAVGHEEVAHRFVALRLRSKAFHRKLSERNVAFACKRGATARRTVGRHSHHLEVALDEVAEIRTFPGDDDPQSHRG